MVRPAKFREILVWTQDVLFVCSEEKKVCNVTVASTDSDKFEAVLLLAHSNVLKIMMVNKKKPHPLVFVGGI